MSKKTFQATLAIVTFFVILFADQLIKISVKTGMYLHESIRVTDWFYILFTENPGMAFGWEFLNKFFLSSFRFVAIVFIGVYLYRIIRSCKYKTSYIFCLALVMAGAAGNMIDCMFYGLIFNNPMPPMRAEFVDFGTGYDSFLLGKVVDMFYFPIIDIDCMPNWVPFIGGERFVFFSPIFNFADAAISCGIVALLLFHHNYLSKGLIDSSSNETEK